MTGLNVLSLFDGMSCGQIALERAGVAVNKYFASEVDAKAIQVTMANYPDTVQLGDIQQIDCEALPRIDLLMGGSPCQDLSFGSWSRTGLEGDRSGLFFDYVRLKDKLRPDAFIFENVRMSKKWEALITKYLGVKPVLINSDILCAQSRKRLYWTNIEFDELIPVDVQLSDIIESGYVNREKSYCVDANYFKGSNPKSYAKGRRQIVFENVSDLLYFQANKKTCQTQDIDFRILTPLECERLQTVPEGYTDHVAKMHRYKMLGNGWTVDVIAHILKGIECV